MKSILIPTDFSDISKNSVLYGFELASKLNLKVSLVHIIELYKFAAGTSETEIMSTVLPVESIKEMELSAEESFKKLITEIKKIYSDSVEFDYRIIPGHLINQMIAESHSENIEFVILAVAETHDLTTRFTHGTISSVTGEAVCPIIVVPSSFSFKPVRKVIYSTGFNKADIDSLTHFIKLFKVFNPEILVIHISPKPDDFMTELKFAGFKQLISERTDYQNITYKLIPGKNALDNVIESTKNEKADMLVMLKEHEGFFKSFFETNKTDKIAHYLRIPLISYHENDMNTGLR